MKLRPLHDRVIIKRLDNERKTSSGIVIPDNAAEKPDQGEILAVGNGTSPSALRQRLLQVRWMMGRGGEKAAPAPGALDDG